MHYPAQSTAYLHMLVAQKKGFFQREGLDVDLILARANIAIAALMSGDIQYSGAQGSAIRAAIKGMPLKVILFTSQKQLHWLVVRPELHRVEDLRGKTIGVSSFGSEVDTMVLEIMKHSGLEPDRDFKRVNIGDTAFRLNALRQRLIDATLLSVPQNIMARREGFGIILEAYNIIELPGTGLATTEQRIRERPDEVRKVIRSLLKSVAYIKENREEAVAMATDWLKIDRSLVEESYKLEEPFFSLDGETSAKGLQASLKIAVAEAGLKETIPLSKVIDLSALNEVRRELGLRK